MWQTSSMENKDSKPTTMDRHLDVLRCQKNGGLLLGASCLTGRYWLGSLWYYQQPDNAPDVDKCTAGVQLEAGISDAQWVDDTHVIVALDTGGLALWSLVDDCKTFLLSHSSMGHDGLASGVSISSDKKTAVSCGYDRCIKEWDVTEMSLLSSYKAHTDMITCTDCHPTESQMFVSCAQDGKLLLWDRRKSKPASLLQTSPLESLPTCVQWQPKASHKMAVGAENGQIALLDTRMGVENYLTSFPHTRTVYRLQFSHKDPTKLASVGEDCKSVLSSIQEDSIKELYSDETHTDFVHGVCWSPSTSSELYTCSWDSTVICHNIKKKMATILGGCDSVPVCVNGNALTDEEGGDDGPEIKKSKAGAEDSKTSYSKALKNGGATTNGHCNELEAEG